ncbi:MAG: TetR/AcrR family transcriptional regulator [Thermomicrobiales bacterium]
MAGVGVRNSERLARLTDAGLKILAEAGARGLTHRAVDAEAGVPVGTTSNYFRTRDDLMSAMGNRIFERLASASMEPDPTLAPSLERVVDYVRDIVVRVRLQPQLTLALLELRLEANRHPDLAAVLDQTLQRNYRADVAFHARAGLPGGGYEVMLLHFAIDGLILDQLTTTIGLDEAEIEHVVADLVQRLVPQDASRAQ